MIQSITVYSNGDSNDLATWSNVPYLFCRALEKRGIKVYRVNIEANKILKRLLIQLLTTYTGKYYTKMPVLNIIVLGCIDSLPNGKYLRPTRCFQTRI